MFIRWDKAKPPKEASNYWYAKLVHSARIEGKVKQKIITYLGKVKRNKEGKLEAVSKVRLLSRLAKNLADLDNLPSIKEINELLKKKELKITPYEEMKYERLLDNYHQTITAVLQKDRKMLEEIKEFEASKENVFPRIPRNLRDILNLNADLLDNLEELDLSKIPDNFLLLANNQLNETLRMINNFQKEIKKRIEI